MENQQREQLIARLESMGFSEFVVVQETRTVIELKALRTDKWRRVWATPDAVEAIAMQHHAMAEAHLSASVPADCQVQIPDRRAIPLMEHWLVIVAPIVEAQAFLKPNQVWSAYPSETEVKNLVRFLSWMRKQKMETIPAALLSRAGEEFSDAWYRENQTDALRTAVEANACSREAAENLYRIFHGKKTFALDRHFIHQSFHWGNLLRLIPEHLVLLGAQSACWGLRWLDAAQWLLQTVVLGDFVLANLIWKECRTQLGELFTYEVFLAFAYQFPRELQVNIGKLERLQRLGAIQKAILKMDPDLLTVVLKREASEQLARKTVS